MVVQNSENQAIFFFFFFFPGSLPLGSFLLTPFRCVMACCIISFSVDVYLATFFSARKSTSVSVYHVRICV